MVAPLEAGAVFPGTTLDAIEILSLEVQQRPYAFDAGRLLTWTPPTRLIPTVRPGTPIRVIWRSGDGNDTVTGYVHAIRPVVDGIIAQTEILFTDAASVLVVKHPTARVYQQMGDSNVVQEICDDHRLYCEVDPTQLKPLVRQDAFTSDWEFLVNLAQADDYTLLASGTTISFRKTSDLLAENAQRMQSIGTFQFVLTPNGRLTEFKPDYSVTRTDDFLYVQNFRFRPPSWETLFPYRADASMTTPFGVRPMDVFRVAEPDAERVWAVLWINHLFDSTGYRGQVQFGGSGRRPTTARSSELMPVAAALAFNKRGGAPPPVLRNYDSVFDLPSMANRQVNVRWESAWLVPPNVAPAGYPPPVVSDISDLEPAEEVGAPDWTVDADAGPPPDEVGGEG